MMSVDTQGETIVKPTPDPTVLTREASDRAKESADKVDQLRDEALQRELKLRQEQRESEVANLKHQLGVSTQNLKEETRGFRADDRELTAVWVELLEERVASIRREMIIYETHRLELKSDAEKTLATATIAAEKAVQAALAAAEKARDQQTIASQLATTKAEEASKETTRQQGETFTLAISSLTTGLGDVKQLLAELRAERRGIQEQVHTARDSALDMKPLTDAVMALTLLQSEKVGKDVRTVQQKTNIGQTAAIIGVVAAVFFGFFGMLIAGASFFINQATGG